MRYILVCLKCVLLNLTGLVMCVLQVVYRIVYI